jgi:hypothetical protein
MTKNNNNTGAALILSALIGAVTYSAVAMYAPAHTLEWGLFFGLFTAGMVQFGRETDE